MLETVFEIIMAIVMIVLCIGWMCEKREKGPQEATPDDRRYSPPWW